MGRIAHRMAFAAPFPVGPVKFRQLFADFAGGPLLTDFPKRAARIQVVRIFGFGIDEIAEQAFFRHAAAEHGLRTVDGGFAKHVFHAGTLDRVDDFAAPVENFVVIGQGDHRHGGIHIFARFQHLDALRRMQRRLRDDHDGIAVRFADLVQRQHFADRFGRDRSVFQVAFDPVRFRIAQNDRIHQRMRGEKRRKYGSETAQSDQAQFDSHF